MLTQKHVALHLASALAVARCFGMAEVVVEGGGGRGCWRTVELKEDD